MREFHKRSGRTDLEVTVDLRGGDGSYAAVTKNIGVGGVFVATERIRPVGDRLALTFALPGLDKPVSVVAEVRWVREGASATPEGRPPGMGLRFVEQHINSTIAIQTFLRDREAAARNGSGPP